MSFLDKAKENYEAAVNAYKGEKYNAAANRLYYALFQACRGEIIKKGMKLKDFVKYDRLEEIKNQKRDTDCEWWPHSDVINVVSVPIERNGLGLNSKDKSTITLSHGLRTKSDYYANAKVEEDDLTELLETSRKLLQGLGVAV